MTPGDRGHHRRPLPGVRRPARILPQRHRRPYGRVHRAARPFAPGVESPQHGRQIGGDLGGFVSSLEKPARFRIRVPRAQHPAQPFDFVQHHLLGQFGIGCGVRGKLQVERSAQYTLVPEGEHRLPASAQAG